MQTNFEIIARALIIHDNKILLCKRKNRDYYFLPGGHIEFGEQAEVALEREIKEELGADLHDISFIGAVENIFRQDEKLRHELNIVFLAQAASKNTESVENHLTFCLIPPVQVKEQYLLPIALKNALIQWLSDKQVFWISQRN